MIGDLTPLRRIRRQTAVHVGQADVEQNGVEAFALDRLQRTGGGIDIDGGELLVQAQLLAQRLAQRVVVVDQQNFLGRGGHHTATSARPRLGLRQELAFPILTVSTASMEAEIASRANPAAPLGCTDPCFRYGL